MSIETFVSTLAESNVFDPDLQINERNLLKVETSLQRKIPPSFLITKASLLK